MSASQSKTVVYAAAVGNGLIAITKFAAAAYTGSSAMLSEAVHSVADTGNQILLLYGMRRASQPPDELHPLGHGRELYFWAFIVALIMFTLGAGVAFYEGVQHILHPTEVTSPIVNYVVLGLAFIFEGASWYIALREFRRTKGAMGYFEAMRRSKDPVGFTVLFEDSAAMLGLLIAFIGTFLGEHLAMPVLDGVASIAISAVLAATAFVLARESKGLLIGEPASRAVRASILDTLRGVPGIDQGEIAFTVHMAPDEIVVALDLEFDDHLTAPEIEKATRELERIVREAHPDVIAIFVKPRATGTPPDPTGRFPGRRRKISDSTAGTASA